MDHSRVRKYFTVLADAAKEKQEGTESQWQLESPFEGSLGAI